MARVYDLICFDCGASYVYTDAVGDTCKRCNAARRVREQIGEGETADQLMALLYPSEFEQEKAIAKHQEEQDLRFEARWASRQNPDGGR